MKFKFFTYDRNGKQFVLPTVVFVVVMYKSSPLQPQRSLYGPLYKMSLTPLFS